MTREQFLTELFKVYRLVSVLSDKNQCKVLRMRNKENNRNIVVRSFANTQIAYEALYGISFENLPLIYDVINLQDLVNGIGWIKENLKGRVCIELDVDRQNVTCFGTPKDVDELIRSEIEALGSPDGGLMMIYGLYPGTPLENAIALMDAMEKYMGYYR